MYFGEIVVKEGFCGEEDVHAALEAQAEGDPRCIGDILLERGRITHLQLGNVLRILRGE